MVRSTRPRARGAESVRASARVAALAVLACGAATPIAASARVSVERVPLTTPRVQVPQLLALGLDVTEDVTATSATVVAASDAERARLRTAGFAAVTVIHDFSAARTRGVATPRAAHSQSLPSGRTSYRTPAEVQADLDALVATHPGLTRRVLLPQRSVEGRPITGVEIATNVGLRDDGRPVYVVMGLHHAREWPSAEIATELALDLVVHQADPRVAALLAGLRIVIVPVVDPDGYQYSRGTLPGGQPDATAAVRRRNCRAVPGDPVAGSCPEHRGVDLNRNSGAFWGGVWPDRPLPATTPIGGRDRGQSPRPRPSTSSCSTCP